MDKHQAIQTYFSAEEMGDVEAVVKLCADTVIIRNAAQPLHYGKDGARQYVTDFTDRTEDRQFRILAIAVEGKVAFSWWDANITFKKGVKFGAIIAAHAFRLQLQGVCRFKFNQQGQIVELDVFHETSTAPRLALETRQ